MHRIWFPIVLTVAACSSADGTLDLSLRADPAPDAPGAPDRIDVVVTAVRVAVVVDPSAPDRPPAVTTPDMTPPVVVAPRLDPDTEVEDALWVTVFEGAQPLDLAVTEPTRTFLASTPVPAGAIEQVRLVIAPGPTVTVDGETSPLRCPSCTPSGIKVVPHGTLEVPAGGTLDLVLTFDVRSSLRRDRVGYWLHPVVRL